MNQSLMRTSGEAKLPLFGILILNYNGLKWLPELFDSLETDGYANKRVYLVDNSSSDDSVTFTERYHREVTILRLPENLGYSMAYNLALQTALEDGCQWLCFLNTDTSVLPGWLDRLAEAADDPSVGVLAPVQWSWSGDGPAHFMSRYGTSLLSSDGVRAIDCDWVEGSCLCARRECIEDVGPFDPAYFFYWEDADYCRRARYHGWRVAVVPKSKIRHYGGGSAAEPPQTHLNHLGRLKTRNHYRFKLSDPFQHFLGNVRDSLRLLVTCQKQALKDQRNLFLASQHLSEFTRALVALPGHFSKWRRDRARRHPARLTSKFAHLVNHLAKHADAGNGRMARKS